MQYIDNTELSSMVQGVLFECNINALFKIKKKPQHFLFLYYYYFFKGVEVNMTVDHVREFIDATFIGRIV